MKTKIAALLLSAPMIFATFGCGGSFRQNPMGDYDSLKNDVPANQVKTDSGGGVLMADVFNLRYEGNLVFVQGEQNTVEFIPVLGFSAEDRVAYDLTMVTGPKDLGATFTRNSNGNYSLTWKPGNILSVEPKKSFDLQIKFSLRPESSERTKREFSGQTAVRSYTVLLLKNTDEPFIEDEKQVSTNINPDQDIKIKFVVAAKGLTKDSDLQVSALAGPATLTSELVQVDALRNNDVSISRGQKLGIDKSGRTRYQFEMTMSSRPIVNNAVSQILKIPTLKAKYIKGDLTSTEALFSVSAVNTYNKVPTDSIIQFDVNLKDKPGKALISTDGSINIKVGGQGTEGFRIQTAGRTGDLSLLSIKSGDQEIPFTNGKAVLANLSIQCATPKDSQCVSGDCSQACKATVDATDCSTPEQNMKLKIKTTSQSGAAVETADLDYAVVIKGKSTACGGSGK